MGLGSRIGRLEVAERLRRRRELEAMTDDELDEHIVDLEARLGVPPGPDVRAMDDAELSAYERHLRGGGDAHDWRGDGGSA